jgi:nitrite reductase/ring-hydroxylating ferredoxin subunit
MNLSGDLAALGPIDSLFKLCDAADVPDDAGLRRPVQGRADLAVFRVGVEFFVVDDLCTHSDASLSEDGYLDGFIIECGWHQGRFDLRSGEAVALPCARALRTYPHVLADGAIYVRASDLFGTT